MSGFGALAPFLPKAAIIGLPCVFALVIAVMLRQREGAAVEEPHGAWMSGATSKNSTFFCANESWAKVFASMNNTQPRPATIKDSVRPWIAALLLAAGTSSYIAFAAQPSVYIDNAGTTELRIWVDGKPKLVASVTEAKSLRPSIEVPYGKHRFGWSPVGATAPTAQTDEVKVGWMGDHLYNPGTSTCYALVLSTYGSDSGKGMADGPQTVTEFYTFKKMDNWFTPNPKTVSTKSSGATRTAIEEMQVCRKLAAASCPVEQRRDLVECAKNATDDAG